MTQQTQPEHERSTGARPTGANDETTAAANVREMFDTIAPTYDRANHILSAGIDRRWWNRTARTFRATLQRPEAVALDLCCGTGDMTLALLKHRPKAAQNRVPHLRDGLIVAKVGEAPQHSEAATSQAAPILAADFSHQTLAHLKDRPKSPDADGCPILSAPQGAKDGVTHSSNPAIAPILAADFSHQMLTHLKDRPKSTDADGCPILSAPQGAKDGVTHSSNPAIAPILAVDFSHQMLALGQKKFAGHNIIAIEADALHLPLADNSIDLVTSAFGFRNLANYEEGLAELHRILRPGGQIGILEANQPEGLTGTLYNLYFKKILPRLGGIISGQSSAYSYLPASVERFPRPPRMLQLIRNAGFTQATWTSYTFGTAGLYRATKP